MGIIEQTGKYVFKREAYRAYRGALKINLVEEITGSLLSLIGLIAIVCIVILLMSNLTSLFYFLVFIAFFTIVKFFKTLIQLFRKTEPIYSTVPIKKSDRRFKHGYKIIGSKKVISGRKLLTETEIAVYYSIYKKSLIKWAVVNGILLAGIAYLYFKIIIR